MLGITHVSDLSNNVVYFLGGRDLRQEGVVPGLHTLSRHVLQYVLAIGVDESEGQEVAGGHEVSKGALAIGGCQKSWDGAALVPLKSLVQDAERGLESFSYLLLSLRVWDLPPHNEEIVKLHVPISVKSESHMIPIEVLINFGSRLHVLRGI